MILWTNIFRKMVGLPEATWNEEYKYKKEEVTNLSYVRVVTPSNTKIQNSIAEFVK